MKTALALALLLPTLAMAKDEKRILIEAKFISAMREAESLLKTYQTNKMNDKELMKALDTVVGLQTSLKGKNAPASDICLKNKRKGEQREAYNKIFELANTVVVGMSLSETEAAEYTKHWLTQNSCQSADGFIADFKKVVQFAGIDPAHDEALQLTSVDAAQYAKAMTKFYCPNIDLKPLYKSYYQEAKAKGLKKNEAREFAQTQVEANAFICRK